MTPAATREGSVAAPRRARPGSDGRRERMLDAVARCFAERGYHETSVDAVVARARTSKTAFYESFSGKEAAFAALLEREGERLLHAVSAAVEAEADPLRRADAGIATFVRACARDATSARILLVESVGTSPLVEERRRSLHARFAAMVQAQIESLQPRGGAQPDAETLGFAVIGAVNEAVVHLLEAGGDPERVIVALEHLLGHGLIA